MRKVLAFLSRKFYRTPEEAKALVRPAWVRTHRIFFLAAGTLLIGMFAYSIGEPLLQWTSATAEVVLPVDQWKVYYAGSKASCPDVASGAKDCLADPGNPTLWEKGANRADGPTHYQKTRSEGRTGYWLAVEITPRQLAKARVREANYLVLGQLRGDFQLWLDGETLSRGHWTDNEPIVLPIPYRIMEKGTPVRLVIYLKPEVALQSAPDYLDRRFGPGFATKAKATGFRRFHFFWSMARPATFIVLNVVMAFIFFGVWSAAPEKYEYAYIALYSLCFGFRNLRLFDLFYLTFDRTVVTAVEFSSHFFTAVFGMLTGFAFARMRNAVFKVTVPAALGLTAIFLLVVTDQFERQFFASDINTYVELVLTLAGSAVCFLQAAFLHGEQAVGARVKARTLGLCLFGVGLLCLAFLNTIEHRAMDPTLMAVLFSKSSPFFLLIFLGGIGVSEYRAEHRLIKDSPVSPFHRRTPLPDSVSGAILIVDLKNSEMLFRLGAKLGRGGELVNTCLSHLWSAVRDNGGVVLQTEGDALRALFPAESLVSPELSALHATRNMARNLKDLHRQFSDRGYIDENWPRFGFRAAIALGEIRPVWNQIGDTRYASWVEAGSGNVMVESARLMEIERQVSSAPFQGDVVILSTELGSRLALASVPGQWLFMSQIFKGKHGLTYEVAAFAVTAADQPLREVSIA